MESPKPHSSSFSTDRATARSTPTWQRGRPLSILFALLAVLGGSGCQRENRSPDVLLITCDTLRPDHLGIYGYERDTSPHLDGLFAEGAVYERAYSTEANTPPSVISILSGQYPQEHGVRIFYQRIRDEVALLPDLMPDAYQTAAFVSNVVLTDEAIGIASRFDYYDDFVDEKEARREVYERRGERTTEAVLRWMEEGWDPERPLLLWVHYMDPHAPYAPPESTRQRFEHEGSVPVQKRRIQSYLAKPGVTDALDYVDRYDEEIAHFDESLGALLEGYAAKRAVSDALVVFTADHGESMIEHEKWFSHGYQVYEEIIRVPLLLSGPGIDAGRYATPVSGVDVVPTILSAVGADRPEGLPGLELQLRATEGRVIESEAFLAARAWRSIVQGDSKWTFALTPQGIEGQRFYDLARDPREIAARDWTESPAPPEGKMDRALADPDRLRAAGSARGSRGRALTGPKIDPRVSERQLEQLRALGYVEEE